MKRIIKTGILVTIMIVVFSAIAHGESTIPFLGGNISIGNNDDPENYVFSLQLLFLLTILTLAPSILIMMTGFTRILIVLSFIRNALGLQQTPPNQVIVGMALFLTFFVMAPIATEVNNEALQPYLRAELPQEVAIERAMNPIRDFMITQTRDKDLALFMNMRGIEGVSNLEDIPTYIIIPAFIISELKTAFQVGFIIFIPFLVIDMVVASTLMAMGMMMLPPVIISLPFKILLFVLVDGWNLIIKSLVLGFK
ncbi:MAG: flagellar type III secretion system pore protein FliP [Tissierellaceae bacterium]